jgi:hypothetical protein
VGGGCSDGTVDLPRRPHPGGFREGKPWKAQGMLLIRGIIEEGEWVEGKLTGLCRRTLPDGRTLEGGRDLLRPRCATAREAVQRGGGPVDEGAN